MPFAVHVNINAAGEKAMFEYFTKRRVPGAEQSDFLNALLDATRGWGKTTMARVEPRSPETSQLIQLRYANRSWPVFITVTTDNWVANEKISLTITNVE